VEEIMKIEGREESENVEDRRGFPMKRGLAIGGGGIGAVVVVILGLIFGFDPQKFLNPGGGPGGGAPSGLDPKEEAELAKFAKVIFHDTEEIWDEQFQKMGKKYPKPTLVLFTGQTDTACGEGETATGPFYCPGDSKVYIDLAFYKELQYKLDAPGDFARAYVIAHEVGHHVQRLLGYSKQVDEARRTKSKVESNHMSVRLELQADYFAGVWAHYGQLKWKFLEPGDIESALTAADHIGDDRLSEMAGRAVRPDSFTHGKSEQRVRWFKKGFETGDVGGARALFELDYDDL
jgi:predicted metalloprotease